MLKAAGMVPLFFIFALLWTLSDTNLLNPLAKLAHTTHLMCQNFVTTDSRWSPVYEALICGTNITDFEKFETLRTLGLVHAFVFSGAHLVFAEKIILKFFKDSRKTFAILFGISLLAGMNPPAVRALIHWSVKKLSNNFELHWGPQLKLAISGLVCLGLNPEWWRGISLPLSWLATLCFVSSSQGSFRPLVKIYFLSLPLLIGLGPASPLSILVNFIFGPVFFVVLFPLSFVAGILHFVQPLVDPIWMISFKLMDLFSNSIHMPTLTYSVSAQQRWAYVFVVQGIHYLTERIRLWQKHTSF